jgi:hypothetical protein
MCYHFSAIPHFRELSECPSYKKNFDVTAAMHMAQIKETLTGKQQEYKNYTRPDRCSIQAERRQEIIDIRKMTHEEDTSCKRKRTKYSQTVRSLVASL